MLHFNGGGLPPFLTAKCATMRWFRTRSRGVSCLALLALALQLALAFGHIHVKELLGKTHSSASVDASTLASLSDEQRTSAQDADGSHHEHEDEYCAVYAINGLIGSAQHAEPPALLMPLRIGRALHTLGYEIPLAELHHALFQARAPPVA
jgi:hypothetical protein